MTKATPDRLSSAKDRCKHGRQQEEGVLVIRTIATLADTNPAGDIFGGWLPRSSAAGPLAFGSLVSIADLGIPEAPTELTVMRLRTQSFAQHEKRIEAICTKMSAILARQSQHGRVSGARQS